MEKCDKSAGCDNSEPAEVVPSSVPTWRRELGTRISVVAGMYGSRKSAASVAEISTDQLARYMRGENEPPFGVLARLATPKGVSLEWLNTGEDPMLLAPIRVSAAPDQVILRIAIEELQSWQIKTGRTLSAEKFAQATLLLCDLANGDASRIKCESERLLKLVA